MPAKYISQDWLSERVALRCEHIPRPTQKQLHDALNESVRDLRETYGELDIPQCPDMSGWR